MAVVVNEENAASGFGIHCNTAMEIFEAGVDVIALSDHTFDQKDAKQILVEMPNLLHPI